MQIDHIETIPRPPRASCNEIIDRLRVVASGEVPAIRISTVNSHRSTIKVAIRSAESKYGVELDSTITFDHDHRKGDLVDAGTMTPFRKITAIIWRKGASNEMDH